MNKFIVFIAFSISLSQYACNPNIDTQEAVRYNNIAINMSNTNIDSALYYFDKALDRDSSYLLARQNKVNLLIKSQRYQKALYEAELLATKIDNSEILRIKGLLYDLTLDSVQAKSNYIQAIEAIDEEVKRVNDFLKYQKLFQKGTMLILLNQPKEGIELIEKYSTKANISPTRKDSIIALKDNTQELIKILLKP